MEKPIEGDEMYLYSDYMSGKSILSSIVGNVDLEIQFAQCEMFFWLRRLTKMLYYFH